MVALAALILCSAQMSATFEYASLTAKSVSYAGDRVGWSSPKAMDKSGDKWTISFSVPPDARLEYKFVVDGQWILDPSNPKKIDNGVGGENSVWEGTKYRFTIHDQTPKRPMRRLAMQVKGREIVVFAPEKSKGLPILVYGDGPNYQSRAKIQNVLQNLVESGKVRPTVIVLVPPIDRMKEYGAGWKEYGAYLFEEVLPAVRRATGASEKAKDVFVGGSSMGGLISLRLAEEFPDKVAGGVHSQSGAFVKYASGADFSTVATAASLRKLANGCRLWLCWGTYEGDLTQANVAAAATLKGMGRTFKSRVTPEGHTWTAWRHRMEEALIYLLRK